MGRMLELIRERKAPTSIMRRAAPGELALPAGEAIEILALLAADGELADEAEQTLRGWDEASLTEVACDAATAPGVLRCLLRTQAERPAVIAALCGNPSLALDASAESDPAMAVSSMPEAVAWRQARELEDEEERPFELVTNAESEADPMAELLERAKHGDTAKAPEEQEQLSLLQRISRMRVGERIKLAMRGGREERMVLIRDRSKLVSQAVLASPKVDASEMESFAAMKNVQESVLRAIAANRKNLKNYGVVRTLVSNPKTPLDVALPLLAHLLIKDLRSLASNKNVNETVRKRAAGLFRIKTETKKDS